MSQGDLDFKLYPRSLFLSLVNAARLIVVNTIVSNPTYTVWEKCLKEVWVQIQNIRSYNQIWFKTLGPA